MARKKFKLSSKQFFTITVLSSTLLVMLFLTTGIMQNPTRTTSDATGDSKGSLSNCGSNYGRSGGIQIFNGPKLTGGSRIMCVRMQTKFITSQQSDKNLGTIQSGSKYYDIWNFNNKMESYKLRANKFCTIRAKFYGKTTYGNFFFESPIVGGTSASYAKTETVNWIPKEYRNKISSIQLWTDCALDKYGYKNYQ